MIIFWIFSLFVGASAFAFGLIALQLGIAWSLIYALLVVVVCRGLLTLFKRWLILSERMAAESNPDERTIETNRALFWRRMLWLSFLVFIYFAAAFLIFGLAPADAIVALPAFLGVVVPQLFYVLALMIVNFMLFFGAFFIYGRIGRTYVDPGEANYDVRIEDVRGQKSAVEEMRRILTLMEQGRNYVKAGGKRERGVLMVGPPGTGKTMLAKGIASSMHVPIIITSGASFQGMFLGMDALNVFMTVRVAKKRAKRWSGCVVFIDEFDALGSRRSGMGGAGGMGGLGGMFGGGQLGLNTLLVLMDGVDNPGYFKQMGRRMVNITLDGLFVPRQIGMNGTRIKLRVPILRAPRYNILFVGATNRPNVLDEAVTRPGRFGRQIYFRMPTREDRKDIADLYFAKKKHDPDLDSPARRDEFARVTNGYSPAMIEQATSVALMYAFEAGRDAFTWRDLREAMGNIEAGLAHPIEYTEREKVATARHELGHAVAARFFLPDQVSVRLSIRMRSGSLGHHRSVDKEEEFAKFRSQSAGELRHDLGAIAAERVFYNENSTGVSMDLIQATQQAALMIGVWGMGPDALPPRLSRLAVSIGDYLISVAATMGDSELSGSSPAGRALGNPRSRQAIAQVLGSAYIDDWRVMYVNKEAIDLAAEALMAQGELVGDEIGGLLDSVGLREPSENDPYPEEIPLPPVLEPLKIEAAQVQSA
ncbi:MAG TPA: AAA family ATPase [Candidatus Limnocylindrales bacterium]|nr:AAA family ATPase [Candidatus Limnocylindrales bacterium]